MKTDRKAAITGCLLAVGMLLCGLSARGESGAPADRGIGSFADMARLRDFSSKRASSWDRSGGNADCYIISGGKTQVLLDAKGAGCIKQIYWTAWDYKPGDAVLPNPFQDLVWRGRMRNMVLRVFWDGETTPSIEVPFEDFFGACNGINGVLNSLMINNCGGGRTCYLPMPFTRGARMELENQGGLEFQYLWCHINYELYDDASGVEELGRLHAQWNREYPTKKMTTNGKERLSGVENYKVLDIEGDGQLAGYFLTVINDKTNSWWGEGDDMVFIDGETEASIYGTGTEEVFSSGGCPSMPYSGPYAGFHVVERRKGHNYYGVNGAYRFFVTDPVRFRKSIRVTFEHENFGADYSSVAFWYQRGVNHNLKPLPPPEARAINCDMTEIEAETFLQTAKTSGKPLVVAEHTGWRGGQWLWYKADSSNDFFSIEAPVKESGRYEIMMTLIKASNFGAFQISVDGKVLDGHASTNIWDAYNKGDDGAEPTHIIADVVSFEKVDLMAGPHTFEFRLVGKNEKSAGYGVGVDCIRLLRYD